MPSQTTKSLWAGAWLVATYKGFSEFNLYEPAFHEYEASILAGRTAQLLSAIRRSDELKHQILKFCKSCRESNPQKYGLCSVILLILAC